MAKRQAFGEAAQQMKASHRKMAKVIISTTTARGKFGYKEAMIDQESVQEFIKKNKS
ncbi:MAG: DUF4295 domain-containing protein [Balneolaceae bacterium]